MLLRRLARTELVLCVALLGAITGLVLVAAVLRFFGRPLIWSVDMAQLLFVWLCMLGATRAMREKAHLGMEVIAKYLPQMPRLWLETASSALILVFLGALAYEGVLLTWLNRERTFGDSTLPYGLVTLAVPVGAVLLGLALIYNIAVAWRRRAEGMLVYTRTPADGRALEAIEL